MISLYISNITWAHRIPAWIKLSGLALASVLVLPLRDGSLLLAACFFVVLAYLSLGRPGRVRFLRLGMLLPLILGLGLFQGLVMSWDAALISVTRILLMVMLADLVTATTPMQDMIRVVLPLFKPLKALGVNPGALALSVALVIRFIPVLSAQWSAQSDAWRSRAGRRPGFKLIIPFIHQALKRTDQIAEAIASRK